ncbi:hypothetical protein D1BOALGB6SA_237 [Olavius sp. associated proteobacterium Delta 1]|nr:hypothetical protein D1BOALGB6SA_237 [Olavius sp. associated proteobacterium Delta 1]
MLRFSNKMPKLPKLPKLPKITDVDHSIIKKIPISGFF